MSENLSGSDTEDEMAHLYVPEKNSDQFSLEVITDKNKTVAEEDEPSSALVEVGDSSFEFFEPGLMGRNTFVGREEEDSLQDI